MALQVAGQAHLTLIDTTYTWSQVIHDGYWGNGATNTRLFRIYGDTLIENKYYKKIYKSGFADFSDPVYYAGVRKEDSVIYIRKYSQEISAIDFKLQASDTSDSLLLCMENKEIAVDYITIDGEIRKRITVSPAPRSEYVWIEGIGNLRGAFLHGICSDYRIADNDFYYLLCTTNSKGEVVYRNEDYESCFIEKEGPSLDRILHVYNNASELKVKLSSHEMRELSVEIFDLWGRRYASELSPPAIGGYSVTFNLKNLSISAGIYLLRIKFGSHLALKKIFIQND